MLTRERRKHPRFPFHSKGELILPDAAHKGSLIDISLFGALFSTSLPVELTPGTECSLQVLSLNGVPFVTTSGVVAHSGNNLIGVEFANLGRDVQERLLHITALNLAPTEVLARELPALLQSKDA